jgi:hypothetical protein
MQQHPMKYNNPQADWLSGFFCKSKPKELLNNLPFLPETTNACAKLARQEHSWHSTSPPSKSPLGKPLV